MAVNMTAQSIAVKQNWVKSGDSYVGDQPNGVSDIVTAYFASQNTAANSPTAIWASSQVADGDGSGTFADPYSLRGAIYSAGASDEVILKDDGTYQLSNPMNLASDFDDTTYPDSFNGTIANGTAWDGSNPKVVTMSFTNATIEAERITIRGEQGALPTIDCQGFRFISLENNPYVTFRALKFINVWDVFAVFDGCTDCEFDLIQSTHSQDAANSGTFLINGLTQSGSITRFYIEGAGQVADGKNANSSGLFIRRVNNWTIKSGTIFNFPQCIYFKHPNDPADVGGLGSVTGLIENVHTYDSDRFFGNELSCNGYTIRNCLLNGADFGANGGTGANGIAEGGSDLTIDNVTFYQNIAQWNGAALATGGSNTPTLLNNIFVNRLDGHPFSSSTTFTVTSSDYNLFGLDAFRINDSIITFSAWQTAQTSDANSIQATPSFVGSDTSVPTDWALQSSTSGTSAGSDGNDMGCDVSNVGYGASI